MGDCRQMLADLPAASAHMVVTSPPYFNLRDYGNEAQIGIEESVEGYVKSLIQVFREVRRVLRPDGTCWVNIGDSFSSGSRTRYDADPKLVQNSGVRVQSEVSGQLLGIPWRVALALQADNWVLRSDVIWSKRNCLPESVAGWRWARCRMKVGSSRKQTLKSAAAGHRDKKHGDLQDQPSVQWKMCPGCPRCEASGGYVKKMGSWRPSRSHEYLFMLAPSSSYFADGEGVREPHQQKSLQRQKGRHLPGHKWEKGPGGQTLANDLSRICHPAGRNQRDVWRLATQPSRLKHFAMMPPEMVLRCLRSGPSKVCEACGHPWLRVAGRKPEEHWAACSCGAPFAAPLVLDPFMGAGTVAGVAEIAGWRWAGCELNPEYAQLLPARIDEVRQWFARRGNKKVKLTSMGPTQQSLF